jgi:hypothetical protein
VFTVGVTGHRSDRLPESELPRIRTQLSEGLKVFQSERTASQCCLISGLADGADQIAAEEALALGWSLEALLPFAPESYVEHLLGRGYKERFNELLTRAARVTVTTSQASVNVTGPIYREHGSELVKRSDALLAVWDGQSTTRIGGTFNVVQLAQMKPIPVLWISATVSRPSEYL